MKTNLILALGAFALSGCTVLVDNSQHYAFLDTSSSTMTGDTTTTTSTTTDNGKQPVVQVMPAAPSVVVRVPTVSGVSRSNCSPFKLPESGIQPRLDPRDLENIRNKGPEAMIGALLDHLQNTNQYMLTVKKNNEEAYQAYLKSCQ